MLAANPESLPRTAEIGLDPVVFLFTLLVSIVTGLLFGMAPLLQLRERIVNISLKEAGQRSTAGAGRARLRSALVMTEVALAVVLVIGAGLLLRSLWNLTTVDAGFKRNQLVTFGVVLPGAQYREPQSRVDFFQRLTSKLGEIPGVQSAAAMSGLPPQRLVNANDVACMRRYANSSNETDLKLPSPRRDRPMRTRLGSSSTTGRSSVALTMVNIVVFRAMPR